MSDHLDAEHRSLNMAAIKSRDTSPEMFVRRMLHSLGYRYRTHARNLVGKPDLVFSARRKVIFVNGCFWHSHQCDQGRRKPKSNEAYWSGKIESNVKRDERNLAGLAALGWESLVVWECELKDAAKLMSLLIAFLGPRQTGPSPRLPH